jgi:hypothetical protein
MSSNQFINLFLVVVMTIGIILAAISMVRETNFSEGDWIAKVDGIPISRAKYLLQLEGLNIDKVNALTKQDELYVLERMIEEELLIRRAVDLGLLKTNTMIRGTIIQQMINSIISDNALKPIAEVELRNFFKENISFFTSANKLRIRQLYFKGNEKVSFRKAQKSFINLQNGMPFEEVSVDGDETTLQIPDTLMTLAKVREYVGPSMMNLAKKLNPGEFTTPKKVSNGYRIIYLVEREDAIPPNFETAKNLIKAEFSKRRDDLSLRSYLDKLKKWYDIERRGVSEE